MSGPGTTPGHRENGPLYEGRTTRAIPGRDGGGRPLRVVALGDSLLTGYGLGRMEDIWLDRALAGIADGTVARGFELIYLARSSDGLRDVERSQRRVPEERPDLVVVSVGSNDRDFGESVPWFPFVSLELWNYRRRWVRVLSALRATGAPVVATGVGRTWRSERFHPHLLRPHRYALVLLLGVPNFIANRAIRRAAADVEGVTFIDVRDGSPTSLDDQLAAHRDVWFGPDGYHPNEAGHELWARGSESTLLAALEVGVLELPRAGRRSWRTRVRDTRSPAGEEHDGRAAEPTVVVMPDSPNVLEHLQPLFDRLREDFRVIGLEMPGAGEVSAPGYDYRLEDGGQFILGVLGRLGVKDAVLTATCVNGLYALAAAAQDDEGRIGALVLGQTSSLPDTKRWGRTTIPWPLRLPVIGDRLLRVARGWVADRWYARTAEGATRPGYLRLARKAFARGADWKLAALARGILTSDESAVLPLRDIPIRVVWGTCDETHIGVSTPSTSLLDWLTDLVGHRSSAWSQRDVDARHFPDLSHSDVFVAAIREAAAGAKP